MLSHLILSRQQHPSQPADEPDALPEVMAKHMVPETTLAQSTVARYLSYHSALSALDAQGKKLEPQALVNTMVNGTCGAYHYRPHTPSIMSAAYYPARGQVYVAFEDGPPGSNTPACCMNYVHFNLTKLWAGM